MVDIPLDGRADVVVLHPKLVYRLVKDEVVDEDEPPVGDPRVPRWLLARANGAPDPALTHVAVCVYYHAASLDQLLDDGFAFSALDCAMVLRDGLTAVLGLDAANATAGDVSMWNLLFTPAYRTTDGEWAGEERVGLRLIDLDANCVGDRCEYPKDLAKIWPKYFGDAYIEGGRHPRARYTLAEVSQVAVSTLACLAHAPMDAFYDGAEALETRWKSSRTSAALARDTIAERNRWLTGMRAAEDAEVASAHATVHTLALALARDPSVDGARKAVAACERIVRQLMEPSAPQTCNRVVRRGISVTPAEPRALRKWQAGPEPMHATPAIGRGGIAEDPSCRAFVVAPTPTGLRHFVGREHLDGLQNLDGLRRARDAYVPSRPRTHRK
jgi:hypothetical protein